MFRRILIANDGSEGGARALTAAIALARSHKAALHMVTVEEMPRFPTTIDEVEEEKTGAADRLEPIVRSAKTQARTARVRIVPHIVSGHTVPSILGLIEREKCDLLVVGFMGHSALYNRLIGSTTDRLVELAPCPVLVVK